MARWTKGEAEIEALLTARELQRLTLQINGSELRTRARKALRSASVVVEEDPDGGFTLAYDAARLAATSLLHDQSLRPTSSGGHYAVEQALRAQFGSPFRAFGALRRRRNELEYPERPHDTASLEEALAAIDESRRILAAVDALADRLGRF
jgi:hypothetical protein